MPTQIALTVSGLGHVPSFKNKKIIVKTKRRPRLITHPKVQQWMERCTQSFASQLRARFPTTGSGTTAECSPPSKTVSWPLDDNWQELEIGRVRTILVPKGQEGADLLIESLP